MSAKIKIEKKVLSENDKIAAEIRERLKQKDIVSLNFVSSPGSGKTSLLEKTIARLGREIEIGLIAGDVQTENDAERLKAAGGKIVRAVVTGGACHLDARMISKALENFDLEKIRMLIIENVGNLVCPSSYDLGEDMKVVMVSVTEGDDKPLKYPAMFRRSSVMVINKTDLLPHCDFNMDMARTNALKINGKLKIFEMSCRTGDGLDEWYAWLKNLMTR
jgi:hydrogenase nickel incorporation protein HypB